MKSVLLSVQPYWVFLIIAKAMGWDIEKEKTVEVRKNYPKADNWDKTVKIYCSKDKKSFARIPKEYRPLMQQFLGKVIGEFICDDIAIHTASCLVVKEDREKATAGTCLSATEIRNYVRGNIASYNLFDMPDFCCWHISDLVIYDKPKELSEFHLPCIPECEGLCEYGCLRPLKRPPQSWCYVEEV